MRPVKRLISERGPRTEGRLGKHGERVLVGSAFRKTKFKIEKDGARDYARGQKGDTKKGRETLTPFSSRLGKSSRHVLRKNKQDEGP